MGIKQFLNKSSRQNQTKTKSHKIMRMNMFAVQDKVKLDIQNASIRGMNLAVVKLKTVLTKLPS
jgi:hypothetical protein